MLLGGQEGSLLVVPQKRHWDLLSRGQRWPSALTVWKLPNLPFTWSCLCGSFSPSRSPHIKGKLPILAQSIFLQWVDTWDGGGGL